MHNSAIYRLILSEWLDQTDEQILVRAKAEIDGFVKNIKKQHDEATSSGTLDTEKYVIPPHLHDLQEADLPETQRGLVISEIALFRERAAKREREKMKDLPAVNIAPSGPKQREWGKPQQSGSKSPPQQKSDKRENGHDKPVTFIKEGGKKSQAQTRRKTDIEMEIERMAARSRDEVASYKDVRLALFPNSFDF